MTLYEAIFARRSVRKYDMTPVSTEILADIKKFVQDTSQLPGQKATFEFVVADGVKNSTAPHSVLAFCADNDCEYANVGYVLQKLDLYMQSIGLGSIWLGSAKPNESESGYCIMLAFGRTDVPTRHDLSEFKRLPIGDISNVDNSVAQAARVAPSAVNSQPWKLDFSDGKVVIKYFGRGLLQLILKKKMSKVDVGIVTRHIEVALENEGKAVKSITPKMVGKELNVEIIY